MLLLCMGQGALHRALVRSATSLGPVQALQHKGPCIQRASGLDYQKGRSRALGGQEQVGHEHSRPHKALGGTTAVPLKVQACVTAANQRKGRSQGPDLGSGF